ncbi:alpha/beta hydrolase [Streptomyces sp. NPDC090025]|uniref:alpha/beta hydrolase n=1 Tax=Streptomyces sp. NPDC090025 TaxID=3365922 RepID=UPI00383630A3
MRRKILSLALAATAATTLTAVATVVTPSASSASSASTAATRTAPAATTPDSLRWTPCPPQAAGSRSSVASRLECATLGVPLDHRDPGGRQIEIAVSRLASENPAKRRGVLLTNPGGPGASGLDYPAQLAAAGLPKDVLDAYDVIGFDPRGVGRSTPVTCDLTPQQQARGNFPPYAHTAADVAREAPNARAVAERCAASRTAWMLPYITTANTARDMDRLRAALGETRISYLGASYGSYLGAVYTTLFPRQSDRVVLDSNMGPGGYDLAAFRLLGRGMEDRFPDFAAYAAAHPEYQLGSTPRQVTAKFFELAKRLDAEPVGGIDGTLFRGVTFDRLYVEGLLPQLAKDWQALDKGEPLPAPPSIPENFLAAHFYLSCGDSRWPGAVADYQRNAAADRLKYPLLGGITGNIKPCAYWPDSRVEPPVRIGDRGPSNVLMVQNERDPGTPLVGALKLRRALGDRATLVTVDQGGHGVYPFGRNTCAKSTVTAFLADGRRPAHDRACAAESHR